jgi:5S rRNA maturation endonuclease (ribonuclease M5)
MKTMNKKYRSYNQHKLKILSDKVCDEIDTLLSHFGIEYKRLSKMIVMSCPIHGGDNQSALNLYPDGDTYRGNWKCRTHHCEEIFKSSIIGFIRGIISNQQYGWTKDGDSVCSFDDALKFAQNFLKQDLSDIKIDKKHIEKTNFVNTVSYINNKTDIVGPKIGHNQIRKSLQIPSKYFLDRGFSDTILEKYDVGDCVISGKEMVNRAVVPVYDMDNKYMVGCTGRSVFEKCKECNYHHQKDQPCPKDRESWLMSKWRHNKDFKTQEHLYNFWFAKEYIQKLKTAIIVESPGNVWRLEEAGIHNSVAIFGSSLSDKQKMLLDISGALSLVLIMDNDDAGKKAVENIKAKCNKTYNIFPISIQYDDVASMTIDQIKHEIIPQINKLYE